MSPIVKHDVIEWISSIIGQTIMDVVSFTVPKQPAKKIMSNYHLHGFNDWLLSYTV